MLATLSGGWHRKLLLGVLVAALALLGLEGGLRLLLGPPCPALEVHLVKGEVDRYVERDGEWMRTLYTRDRDRVVVPLASPSPRFAVLGGSSVHEGELGVGAPREFTQVLASRLGVSGLNLGSPGLDSHDLVQILDELEGVDLDAVVVYAGHNDLGNLARGRHHRGLAVTAQLQLRSALERSQLYWVLAGVVDRDSEPVHRRGPPAPLSDEARAEAVRHFEANLAHMAWQAGRIDLPLVVVVPVSRLTKPPDAQACEPPDCPLELFEQGTRLRGTDPEGAAALLRRARDVDGLAIRAPSVLQDAVRALAAKHPHVHLVDAPVQLPQEPELAVPSGQLFSDPLHFSVAGHAAMAEAIAPVLAPLLDVAWEG